MSDKSKGREYFDQVRQDHEELRQLLGTVSGVLADRQEAAEKVAQMFTSLCDRVQSHFDEEEGGGFFDQVIEQAPHMSDRAGAVRDEHRHLLGQINGVLKQAHTKTGSADWWQQLHDEFRDFSKVLMHHESKEAELIQEAYGEDIGSTD